MRRRPVPVAAVLLAGVILALAGCGKSSSGSEGVRSGFLLEHNAQFNGGRTIRWPGLPISVATNGIARSDEVTAWTGATGGAVTFTLGDGGSANITIRFRGGTDICGVTTVEFTDDGVITSADVRVSQAIFRSPQCVRTVTHEIGHAIGFLDHTMDGGLMDADGGDGRISQPVGDVLATLYSLPPNTSVSSAQQRRGQTARSGRRQSMTFVYLPRR